MEQNGNGLGHRGSSNAVHSSPRNAHDSNVSHASDNGLLLQLIQAYQVTEVNIVEDNARGHAHLPSTRKRRSVKPPPNPSLSQPLLVEETAGLFLSEEEPGRMLLPEGSRWNSAPIRLSQGESQKIDAAPVLKRSGSSSPQRFSNRSAAADEPPAMTVRNAGFRRSRSYEQNSMPMQPPVRRPEVHDSSAAGALVAEETKPIHHSDAAASSKQQQPNVLKWKEVGHQRRRSPPPPHSNEVLGVAALMSRCRMADSDSD